MNIEDLLPDTGKLTAIHAADVAMQKTKLIPVLLKTAFEDIHPLSTRAANTIEIIDSKNPELIKPYYKKIITGFNDFKVDGVKRCLLKIFTRHIDLEEELLCRLLNFCFDCVASSSETVGVKAYSLMILYEISNKEPDIKNELSAVISTQLQESQPAFKAIGHKLLAKLHQEIS
jgi:hypothetical protein